MAAPALSGQLGGEPIRNAILFTADDGRAHALQTFGGYKFLVGTSLPGEPFDEAWFEMSCRNKNYPSCAVKDNMNNEISIKAIRANFNLISLFDGFSFEGREDEVESAFHAFCKPVYVDLFPKSPQGRKVLEQAQEEQDKKPQCPCEQGQCQLHQRPRQDDAVDGEDTLANVEVHSPSTAFSPTRQPTSSRRLLPIVHKRTKEVSDGNTWSRKPRLGSFRQKTPILPKNRLVQQMSGSSGAGIPPASHSFQLLQPMRLSFQQNPKNTI